MKKGWLAVLLMAALAAGCATTPHAGESLKTVTHVELDHFMGRWYVIANIPYALERGRVGAYVEYSMREDGRINDWYFSQDKDFDHPLDKKEGIATVTDTQSNASWSVRFIWPFDADYRILYVDPEYRYAVIGHPSRDYAWIFARDVYVSDENYQLLLAVLTEQGYDPTRVLKIPPRPEFLGIPGYQ
jgi:apolipoprotein D and lipocalin family protein